MEGTRLGDRNSLWSGLRSRRLGIEAKEKRPSVPRMAAWDWLLISGVGHVSLMD